MMTVTAVKETVRGLLYLLESCAVKPVVFHTLQHQWAKSNFKIHWHCLRFDDNDFKNDI